MGLPQIDFRVPEATWFKSALAGRFGGVAGRFSAMPGLSSTGALAWPYKIAVVAVMAIVACGTLVTFGSAEAETPAQSAEPVAMPGSDEVGPTVEGQVIPPPSAALLNSADLLSTLNLTDYTPYDINDLSSSNDDDDEDNDDEDSDDDTESDIKKKLAGADPKPSAGSAGGSDSDSDEEEGPKHKQWAKDQAAYEQALKSWESAKEARDDWDDEAEEWTECKKKALWVDLGKCGSGPGDKPADPGDKPTGPGSEPKFTD